MQRSSESIAALAAALAKAQIELSNPEKSLVGTIEPRTGEGGQRLFRYAPLSSGLEIVRKTLGQHEIATVQTTAIDQSAGIVNLTTVLAHASGEWISSDWPVCAISETATPHRMGAALTYARRYALFTLVGIAGEDDLDAPDLVTPTTPSSGLERPKGVSARSNGGAQPQHGRAPVRRPGKDVSSLAAPSLAPEESGRLRSRLLAELNDLLGGDEAALWAQRSLLEKNKLTAADAQCVETAFQKTLETLQESRAPVADVIDKGVLSFPEPRRVRDKEHLKFVANQPCLRCGRRPSDPHHIRFAQNRALGRKVSDEFTVPLCRGHHREVHRCGDEAVWWLAAGIDPLVQARTLWLKTRPLPVAPDNAATDGTGPVADNRRSTKPRIASARKRGGAASETKPILRARPQ
jgi:ERF superfamily